MSTLTKLAAWYLDKNARAPRNFGRTVDDGMPDRGKRYGGAQTIHNTGTIDVVIKDGRVTEVWFRCMQLAASVNVGRWEKNTERYLVDGVEIVAVETAR